MTNDYRELVRLDLARRDYISELQKVFEDLSARLLDEPAAIEYRRGWASDISLAQAFEEARTRDLRLKTSTVGPHRADVSFQFRGKAARDLVSRGQQKMLASAFILSQIRYRSEQATVPTCLLLDDPAAELDVDNLGKLLEVIDAVPSQLIVTSVSEAGLRGMHIGRKFHVEQGRFTPMV
jgi:DNA replication and repair protein RecF